MQSKGLSGVFSSTTVRSIDSLVLCPLHSPLSHPYMTTGKTVTLTRRTFAGKVMHRWATAKPLGLRVQTSQTLKVWMEPAVSPSRPQGGSCGAGVWCRASQSGAQRGDLGAGTGLTSREKKATCRPRPSLRGSLGMKLNDQQRFHEPPCILLRDCPKPHSRTAEEVTAATYCGQDGPGRVSERRVV